MSELCRWNAEIAAAVANSATLQREPAGEVQPQTAAKVLETDRLPADDLVAKAGGAVFTNFTAGFVGCLDYILFTARTLRRRRVLR